MGNKARAALAVVAALTLALTAVSCGSERYVATIGSEKVTEPEFIWFMNYYKSYYAEMFGITDWSIKAGDQTIGEFVKELAYSECISAKVEFLQAQEEGFKLSQDDLANINSSFQRFMDMYGGKAEADKQTKEQYGVGVDDYKKIYTDLLELTQKFRNAKMAEIVVSEAEAREEYAENRDYYDAVDVRHILFLGVDDDGEALPEAELAAQEELAGDVMARILAGEDMLELAYEYSEDWSIAYNDGLMRFDSYGNLIEEEGTGYAVLVQEFPEWAFKAEVGDINVIRTEYGFHIVRLEWRSVFDDLKENLILVMKSKAYKEEFLDRWLAEDRYKAVMNEDVFNSIKIG
ncbi:MAG: peptidylprolyl isomerase [Oscillospiraceae bacterium]|nr:peptidylprolyl isomerase [Oscillospiraceae bacterium]